MSPPKRKTRWAFTLVELIVVIGTIVLIMAIALPSILTMFTAGGQDQAVNLLAAELTAARQLAIRTGTYCGVHVQMADPSTGSGTACYIAVVSQEPNNSGKFVLAPGYIPTRMPGTSALGRVDGKTVDSSGYFQTGGAQMAADANTLCNFSVIFSPTGKAVQSVPPTTANTTGYIYYNTSNTGLFSGTGLLWNGNIANQGTIALNGVGDTGVTCIIVFDSGPYFSLTSGQLTGGPSNTTGYLSKNCQFLPINVQTGQLYPRR